MSCCLYSFPDRCICFSQVFLICFCNLVFKILELWVFLERLLLHLLNYKSCLDLLSHNRNAFLAHWLTLALLTHIKMSLCFHEEKRKKKKHWPSGFWTGWYKSFFIVNQNCFSRHKTVAFGVFMHHRNTQGGNDCKTQLRLRQSWQSSVWAVEGLFYFLLSSETGFGVGLWVTGSTGPSSCGDRRLPAGCREPCMVGPLSSHLPEEVWKCVIQKWVDREAVSVCEREVYVGGCLYVVSVSWCKQQDMSVGFCCVGRPKCLLVTACIGSHPSTFRSALFWPVQHMVEEGQLWLVTRWVLEAKCAQFCTRLIVKLFVIWPGFSLTQNIHPNIIAV